MLAELTRITVFIWKSILHVWPYLLISAPIAVAVRMSGASNHIGKVFSKKPVVSILLATIVGAFSPFCSCSVIPIIASLLIGGVPLAPVMSFWLASPSMDPEIFFLSVTVLGWKLAVWRLSSAFAMSFISGLITHFLVKRKWITEEETLKAYSYLPSKSSLKKIKQNLLALTEKYFSPEKKLVFVNEGIHVIRTGYGMLDNASSTGRVNEILSNHLCCSKSVLTKSVAGENISFENRSCDKSVKQIFPMPENNKSRKVGCCDDVISQSQIDVNDCDCGEELEKESSGCECSDEDKGTLGNSFSKKLFKESFNATSMVIKFMILAYFLEALIVLYVPDQFITLILGTNHFLSIIMAALIGIPVYTSSMPALALVGGLISKGMIPAAGLAFLISGPTTTIPAMAAVWNLASRKVFFLYVGFTLVFAIVSGVLFNIFS